MAMHRRDGTPMRKRPWLLMTAPDDQISQLPLGKTKNTV